MRNRHAWLLKANYAPEGPGTEPHVLHVALCRLGYPYTSAWFLVFRSRLRTDLGLEQRHCGGVSCDIFAGWRTAKMYATRPTDRPCYYAFTALVLLEGLLTNRLQLMPSPSIFPYCNNILLERKVQSLNYTVIQSSFDVCTVVQFLSLACDGVTDTFDLNHRLSLSSGCFVCIGNKLADLIGQVKICFTAHRSGFDTASYVYAWRTMRSID